MKMTYETSFSLGERVKSFTRASIWLWRASKEISLPESGELAGLVTEAEIYLTSDTGGFVQADLARELNEDELAALTAWARFECERGIGASFVEIFPGDGEQEIYLPASTPFWFKCRT